MLITIYFILKYIQFVRTNQIFYIWYYPRKFLTRRGNTKGNTKWVQDVT